MDMLLTISGPPGGRKNTIAVTLVETFNLEYISGGDISREFIAEHDMTAIEFNRLAEEDGQIDHDLDRHLRNITLDHDDMFLESHPTG